MSRSTDICDAPTFLNQTRFLTNNILYSTLRLNQTINTVAFVSFYSPRNTEQGVAFNWKTWRAQFVRSLSARSSAIARWSVVRSNQPSRFQPFHLASFSFTLINRQLRIHFFHFSSFSSNIFLLAVVHRSSFLTKLRCRVGWETEHVLVQVMELTYHGVVNFCTIRLCNFNAMKNDPCEPFASGECIINGIESQPY